MCVASVIKSIFISKRLQSAERRSILILRTFCVLSLDGESGLRRYNAEMIVNPVCRCCNGFCNSDVEARKMACHCLPKITKDLCSDSCSVSK